MVSGYRSELICDWDYSRGRWRTGGLVELNVTSHSVYLDDPQGIAIAVGYNQKPKYSYPQVPTRVLGTTIVSDLVVQNILLSIANKLASINHYRVWSSQLF